MKKERGLPPDSMEILTVFETKKRPSWKEILVISTDLVSHLKLQERS
jgi:hypothetical protein